MLKLIHFLQRKNLRLVLVDVGASGEVWTPFKELAPVSDIVRFDPDERTTMMHIEKQGRGRIFNIPKAVIESDAPDVDFFLTKSPYCSSTLPPDMDRIRDYTYEDLFEVVGKKKLPAITLDKALQECGLDHIDWIKLDTQGTELRILRSMSDNLWNHLAVCDVEASLYAHYIGADIMPGIHDLMLEGEFWLAKYNPHIRTRISKQVQEYLKGFGLGAFRTRVLTGSMPLSPTSIESTYARTVRGARQNKWDEASWLRLFAVYYTMDAFEYCIELIESMRADNLCLNDLPELTEMTHEALINRVRRKIPAHLLSAIRSRIKNLVKGLRH